MLKNMKIRKRLIFIFLMIAVLSSVSGVVAILSLIQTNNQYSHAMERYGFDLGDVAQLGMQNNAVRAHIRDVVFLTDADAVNDAISKLNEAAQVGNALMPKVEEGLQTEQGKAIWKDYMNYIDEYRAVRDQVIELVMRTPDEVNHEAYELWVNEGAPAINSAIAILEDMIALKTSEGNRVSTELDSKTTDTIAFCIIVVLVALLVALVLSFTTSKSISKPIVELETMAKRLSEGKLDFDITYRSENELGQLSESMRSAMSMLKTYIDDITYAMDEFSNNSFVLKPATQPFVGDFNAIEVSIAKVAREISETLMQIKNAADQVAAGSDQVSFGAHTLAQGASEQASSAEELSASITELTRKVRQNADNAKRASDKSAGAAQAIENSNEQMQRLSAAMDIIDEKSVEINKIIKTIEDIAFQTNILALNAAVEAARAGGAGKGFAVVADEVRNLAGKSAEAAKNTTALIEDSVSSVTEGVKLANATAQDLREAVESVNEVTGLITQITQASSEQAGAIAQISVGIEQISSVVHTNSSTSEESAAASEELAGQAGLLKELVKKFKISELIPAWENNMRAEERAEKLLNADRMTLVTAQNNGKY